MIPGLKEQLVGLINEPGYVPLKMEELAKIFDIHTSERLHQKDRCSTTS